MKIRFALTIHITRTRDASRATEAAEPPHVDERSSALIERSETAPIGFTIQPTSHQDPFEQGEDRAAAREV